MGGPKTTPIAHSSLAKVEVGSPIEVHVRVRDLAGRPLAGATVNFISRISIATTDAEGLAVLTGLTGISDVTFTVSYTPQFTNTVSAAITVAPRTLSTANAFDATPEDSPVPGAGPFELHATVLVPTYYPLKALFSWQNPIIRKKIYMAAVSVGQFLHKGDVDHPDLNRLLRLHEIIGRLDPKAQELRKAQGDVSDAMKKHAGEQAQLDKQKATLVLDQAANEKKPSTAAQTKITNDHAAIDKTNAQLLDNGERLMATANALTVAQASHGGSTHREAMEYLYDKVFPQTDLEPWIKYGIVHLTGLRYRPSAGCCHPADDMVKRLRQKEIDELEHASSSSLGADAYALKQRSYAREYLALMNADPTLLKDAQSVLSSEYKRVLGGTGRKFTKIIPELEKIASSKGPFLIPPADPMAPKNKPPPPNDTYNLRVIASAVSDVWIKNIGVQAKGVVAPRDENEFLGEILDRFWKKQIPEVVYRRAVMCTQLLHDFMDASWDTSPRDWNEPKVPKEWERIFSKQEFDWLAHHSETQQPFITGVVCNDVASTLARSRGIPLDGAASIEGIVGHVAQAGKTHAEALEAARAQAEKLSNATAPVPDPNAPQPVDAAPPPKPPVAPPPTPDGDGFVGLYRPRAPKDIKRGDFMFFAHWTDAASESWEVHTVVPSYILDLDKPKPVTDPDNFGAALQDKANIPDIHSLDEIVIPDHKVAFAKQIDRGGKLIDRIVRAWYRNPPEPKKPAVKAGAKAPDPPPPAVDPDKPVPPIQRTAVYEACTFLHIATVVDVRDGGVLNLETADPVGFAFRGWDQCSNPAYFFGRIPSSNPPDLSWFLNRDNLLIKGRLDDG